MRRLGPKAWLACGFLAWLAAFGTMRAGPSAGEEPAPAAQNSAPVVIPAQAGAVNVGEDTCLACHSGQKGDPASSPHHRTADPRSPAAKQGCESCHGPGSKHITDPAGSPMKSFKKLTADEINQTCASCHNRGEHALWDGSQHEARGLSCVSCHSVHTPTSETGQLKAATQMQLCASCHRDKVSRLDRSGHMPVREGKLTCTSCHNVHGSTSARLMRTGDTPSELCVSCHAEKRGPYLWEHAPSRDGCLTCHDAHGSSNERMLVAKPPLLCQRCHIATRHPSTIYDGSLVQTSVRVFARSCVTCHVAIHGSNHPSGQRFVR